MAFDKPQSRNEAILQNMLGANNELEPPKSRVEALLQELSGKMPEANPSEGTTTGTLERLKIGDDIYTVEGGGSGASDYDALNNKPQIAGTTLSGNKSLADLGIASATAVSGILDGTDIDSFGDVETALGDKVDKVEGKGLSTNDYDDTEKAAVAAATTAIAGIKDGTTIDSFADVETALADKQDATDNSLETEAKTIVGAINENAGDIGQLKSGFTNLSEEVNGDATVYPYADVITIPDAVPANLADCNVKIEPVQDLHGQSAPYVGGAGKNKLPLTVDGIKAANTEGTWNGNVYTINNGTFTVNTDSDGNVTGIKANGTFNALTYFVISPSVNTTELAGCLVSGIPASESGFIRYRIMTQSSTSATQDFTANDTAIVDNGTNLRFAIRISDTSTQYNVEFYPMVRLATETDATFAPYTNVCPISGHTEASVQRDGGNLWDEITEAGAIDPNTGEPIVASGFIRSVNYTKVLPNADYYVVANNHSLGLRYYDRYHNIIGYDAMSANSRSITTPNNCRYIKLVISQSSYTNDIAINSPATITTYTAYQGKTYTIALGDTIYGGTVDFDSGVMTVDRAFVEYDGSNDEEWNKLSGENRYVISKPDNAMSTLNSNNAIANQFSISTVSPSTTPDNMLYIATTNLGVRYNSIETIEDWITFLGTNPLDVCYTLDTPTTIQLTPQQIQLLQGQNTLTASTGDISVTVNGVSGSIGSVQEQVNELAEDVAEKQDRNVYMSDWGKTFTVKCAINTLIMLGGSGTRSYLYIYNNYTNMVTPITDSSETVTAVKNEDGTTTFTWEHDMHMSVIPLDAVIAS